METSGIADRIALLAHDPLVKMYEGLGFESRGKSNVKFGGGGWNDLVRCAIECRSIRTDSLLEVRICRAWARVMIAVHWPYHACLTGVHTQRNGHVHGSKV